MASIKRAREALSAVDASTIRRTGAKARSSAQAGASELRGFLRKPLASFYLVIILTAALVVFGLVMMASASAVDSMIKYNGSAWYLFNRQLIFVVLGIIAMVAAMRLRLQTLRRTSGMLMILSILLLILVLIPGVGVYLNGARRWLNLGITLFQPSEMGKIAFLLWGAHVLVQRKKLLDTWGGLLKPLLPGLMLVAGLVVLEPDLHTTVIYVIIFLTLLWVVGTPARLFLLLGAGALGAGVIAIATQGFRMDRITGFLDPWADPDGTGYHALQGFYALGTGGLFGVGLGNSRTKWGALPNSHSDYIFAIIGEELGLIGCLTVLALFIGMLWLGLRIAHRTKDLFVRLVSSAIVVWMFVQALINIGYVVGLLPVTGITLPLISSGGTSLVVTMFAMGLLASCARREPAAVRYLQSRKRRFGRWLSLPVPESPSVDMTSSPRPGRGSAAKPAKRGAKKPARKSSARPARPRQPAAAGRGGSARTAPKRTASPARSSTAARSRSAQGSRAAQGGRSATGRSAPRASRGRKAG